MGKFTYICHFKRVEIKAKMLKQKKRAFILITRDIFVALAVVVAKAPYILESDSSILVLLQARMIKCGKVSEFLGQIFNATKHCIGFTLDFGFKIYRDLTKSDSCAASA